jgi:hypothetical protein
MQVVDFVYQFAVSWISWLGTQTAKLIGLDLSRDGILLLGILAIACAVFTIVTVIVSIAGALSGRSSRSFRGEVESNAEAKRMRSIRERHAIAMLKMQRQQQKRSDQLEHLQQRLERANRVRFREVGFFLRLKDRCSALLAATSRANLLPLQVRSFYLTLEHAGYSVLRAREHEIRQFIARRDGNRREQIFALRQEQKAVEVDRTFTDEMIERLNKHISEHESPDEEEVAADRTFKLWETAVGRPVFIERFVSFFQRNIAEWRRSMGQGGGGQATLENASAALNENSAARLDRISSLILRIWELFSVTSIFRVIAVPAELLFSYPIFLALTNGDKTIAVAGATVFTFGLMTAGELAGYALMRTRSHRLVETPQPTLVVRWRFVALSAAIVLIAVGCAGVYAGATLRQNAGEALRMGEEISGVRDQITILDRRRTTATTPGSAEEQANANLQGVIERLQKDVSDKEEVRRTFLRTLTSPFENPEGRMALVIFAVFFISAVAGRIFQHDPIYEYSLLERRLARMRQERFRKLLILNVLLDLYRGGRQQLEKQLELKKNEVEHLARNEEEEALLRNWETDIAESKEEVRSYVHARCLVFCTTLGRFRNFVAEDIEALLEQLQRKGEDAGKSEAYEKEAAE